MNKFLEFLSLGPSYPQLQCFRSSRVWPLLDLESFIILPKAIQFVNKVCNSDSWISKIHFHLFSGSIFILNFTGWNHGNRYCWSGRKKSWFGQANGLWKCQFWGPCNTFWWGEDRRKPRWCQLGGMCFVDLWNYHKLVDASNFISWFVSLNKSRDL